MKKFSLNIFMAQIQRLSYNEVRELLKIYDDDINKLSIVDINQICNFIDAKVNIINKWQENSGLVDVVDIFTLSKIATRTSPLSPLDFDELDTLNKLHPTVQIEIIKLLSETEKINLLNAFGEKLLPIVIQALILNLTEPYQKIMLEKYKNVIIQVDYKLLLSFIATLTEHNQIFFLGAIKEYIKTLDEEKIAILAISVYDENIEVFFKEYQDIINSLEDNNFIKFLTLLSGDAIILCSKYFAEKIKAIPADILMYKIGMTIDDMEKNYNFWKSNSDKLSELSSAYFNLIIRRLDDNLRLNSLIDFKDGYNRMDVNDLLNLFEFDNDKIKLKLFLEYPNKVNEIDDVLFIDYVIENIDNSEYRRKIFLLYKEKLCSLNDKDFIHFIRVYSNRVLRYLAPKDKLKRKDVLIQFFTANFKDRLQAIKIEFLPKLFSASDTCLHKMYVTVLDESIRDLIKDKTYIKELLQNAWGNSRSLILESFKDEFKNLTGEDWFNLLGVIGNDEIQTIEDLLLTCKIDSLDFINKEKLLANNAKRIYSYFERNIINRLYLKYTELANNNLDELMNRYEEVITKLFDEDKDDVLINYNCYELFVIIRVLFENKIINDKDDYYQMFKEFFMSKLLNGLEKENEENINIIKDSLFYRLVKGSITPRMLLLIKDLKGLIFFTKINLTNKDSMAYYTPYEMENFVLNLTEEQVIKLNNKLFRQICELLYEKFKDENPEKTSIRNLAIKMFLAVGYQNAKELIALDVSFTKYEYVFNGIDIKRIKLNANGEPIINKKLNNFMFGSNIKDENTNINRLLQNKIPEFESRFADIYNSWDIIYDNLNGNVTVARILNWFEDNKILLNPDEYRLGLVINEIGSNEENLLKARELYADMRNRKFSTIPKVSGELDDNYTYEMLDLDDPLGLVVGYITRCCFLIDGQSKTSLFHAVQSKDGRIFVVRKDGELIAQSWVWRNGNLVCFDNVEARGFYDEDLLLATYRKAAEGIMKISQKDEDVKEQIKLVTFGSSYSKISLPEESVPYGKIQKPRVTDYIYSDALYKQYILATNGDTELYYGDVEAEYKDMRKEPKRYMNLSLLDREQKSAIIKKIRAIDYVKNGSVRTVDFENYCYAIIADDWYILIATNGKVECVLLENDSRGKKELYNELDKLNSVFSELRINVGVEVVKENVLSLVRGSEQ